MILLVDAGNSRIKWRISEAGKTLAEGDRPTGQADHLQPDWTGLPLAAAVVSCVAGEVVEAAIVWQTGLPAERIHKLKPLRERHGLVNRYEPPERLGPDRYAALVAARRLGLGDCVLASVGTAMTVDILTREGVFLGGCITPGPGLMRSALAQGTALLGVELSQVEGEEAGADDLPRTTAAALSTGISLALVGVIEGMRGRLERRVGRQARIVLTGGACARVKPGLTGPFLEWGNLVLEGLSWIARDLGYDA